MTDEATVTIETPDGWTALSETAIKQERPSHPTTLKLAHQPHDDRWMLIEDSWLNTEYVDDYGSKAEARKEMFEYAREEVV